MRSSYLMVPKANSQNKKNHTTRKALRNCVEKRRLFLGSILFEVACPFWRCERLGRQFQTESLGQWFSHSGLLKDVLLKRLHLIALRTAESRDKKINSSGKHKKCSVGSHLNIDRDMTNMCNYFGWCFFVWKNWMSLQCKPSALRRRLHHMITILPFCRPT